MGSTAWRVASSRSRPRRVRWSSSPEARRAQRACWWRSWAPQRGFSRTTSTPARIFLGDSGSLLAGFLLAVTAITGQQKGATTLAAGVPLLAFALPLLETVTTVVRRFVAGQRDASPGLSSRTRALSQIFAADSGHLHHRLARAGLPPTRHRVPPLPAGLRLVRDSTADDEGAMTDMPSPAQHVISSQKTTRRHLILLVLMVVGSGVLRACLSWPSVFAEDYISFLETDAWYHMRLVDALVADFPWRLWHGPVPLFTPAASPSTPVRCSTG